MRKIIEIAIVILGWVRHKIGFRIRASDSIVKLNLGCGLAVHQGWINIDGSLNTLVSPLPQIFHRLAFSFSGAKAYYSFGEYNRIISENHFFHADLSFGIPANNGSVDFIYSSHFIEHLYPSEAKKLLLDCHRVLKPGGMVRICVPDLEYAVNMYKSGRKREALDRYFFVENKGSVYARHKYMYDFELLAELLRDSGFHSIRRCRFREGKMSDLEFLDNQPEETLFVETEK